MRSKGGERERTCVIDSLTNVNISDLWPSHPHQWFHYLWADDLLRGVDSPRHRLTAAHLLCDLRHETHISNGAEGERNQRAGKGLERRYRDVGPLSEISEVTQLTVQKRLALLGMWERENRSKFHTFSTCPTVGSHEEPVKCQPSQRCGNLGKMLWSCSKTIYIMNLYPATKCPDVLESDCLW